MATVSAIDGSGSLRGLLRDRDIRLLWSASLFSTLGEYVAQVALPLLVFSLTGSTALLGLVFALSMLPRVLLAPFAGMLADRADRRLVMLGADLGRMVAVATLPFADRAWPITIVAVVVACLSTLYRPAELAAVPMVAGRDRVLAAVSLAQVTRAAVSMTGPALGAGLIATVGAGPTFFVQAGCYILSTALLLRLRLPPMAPGPAGGAPRAGFRTELTVGLRIAGRDRVIRSMAIADAFWTGAGVLLSIGLIAYTERTLDLGERAGTVFGLLVASFSSGAVVGGLLAGRAIPRLGRPLIVGAGYGAPLLLAVVGLVPPLPLVFLAIFLCGLADSWLVAVQQQIFVERVADTERGRFFAVWSAAQVLGATIWTSGLGGVFERVDAPVLFGLVGLVCGLGCPLIVLLSGTLREIGAAPPRP